MTGSAHSHRASRLRLSPHRGCIGAEEPRERRMLAQGCESVDHLGGLRRSVDVGVEDVLPGASRSWARLELRQAQMALRERAEAAIQRAGDVADSEDE